MSMVFILVMLNGVFGNRGLKMDVDFGSGLSCYGKFDQESCICHDCGYSGWCSEFQARSLGHGSGVGGDSRFLEFVVFVLFSGVVFFLSLL